MPACCHHFKAMKKHDFSYLSLQFPLLSPKVRCTGSWQKHACADECVHRKHWWHFICQAEPVPIPVAVWSKDSPCLISPSGKRGLFFSLTSPLQTVHRQYNKTWASTGSPGALSVVAGGWGQPVSAVSFHRSSGWLRKMGCFMERTAPAPVTPQLGWSLAPLGWWDGPWLPDPALRDPQWVAAPAPSSHS